MAHNPPAAHQEDHPGRRRRSEMSEALKWRCGTSRGTNPPRMLSYPHTHWNTKGPTDTYTFTHLTVYSIWRWLSADDFKYSTAHCDTVRALSLLSLQASLNLVRMYVLAPSPLPRGFAAYPFCWNLSQWDFRVVPCIGTAVSIDNEQLHVLYSYGFLVRGCFFPPSDSLFFCLFIVCV